MTDKEYIIAIQQNDQLAFVDLYDLYRAQFFCYIRKAYNKSDDYIADLYQDASVALWQNIQRGKLTPESLTSSLGTYLIGIGKFALMARDRRYKEILEDSVISIYAASDNEDELRDSCERNEIIQSTVNDMGEPCRSLLDKFYWEEMSGDKIASEMGYKNADTVKTQKYKCMQKLKAVITSVFKINNLL